MEPEKEVIDAVAKATAEIVKATPVYQDVVQPVAQEMGKALKTLGGVINVALAPVAVMVYGFDLIREQLTNRLEKQLAKTSPENIISPSLQIVGPLIEKYRFTHDKEELSQMYIHLLASAMDKESTQKAHPSFVNIISELSPDEAKLIKTISGEALLPKIDIRYKTKPDLPGYRYALCNFSLLGEKAKLQHLSLTPSYLSNLERLGIISCPIGDVVEQYTNEDVYKPLEENDTIALIKKRVEDLGMGPVELMRSVIKVTDYGKLFIDAVLGTKVV